MSTEKQYAMTIETFPPMTAPTAGGTEIRSARKLSAALIAGLLVVETAVFYWTFMHNVAPFYPINSDQTSYYLDTYRIIANGWPAVVDEFIFGRHATGVGLTVQGAILGLLFGANRAVIASLNLAYFLVLQLVLFSVIFARTRSLHLSWLGIAFLISCQTIFNAAGGIYDFRIDFCALCLYGIWVCSILWSEVFRHARESLIVAAAGILLISFRYFTSLYAAAVLGGLLIVLSWLAFKSLSTATRHLARLRIRNLLMAGVVIALVICPLLFVSRNEIYGYYGIGHVLGEEKYIRAHQLGLFTVLDHILYYPQSIYRDHLRWPSVVLMTIAVVVVAGTYFTRSSSSAIFQRLSQYSLDFLVLALSIVFPVVALTSDISKSSIVGGIVIVPIVLLLTFLCAVFWSPSLTATADQEKCATASTLARKSNAAEDGRLGFLPTVAVSVVVLAGLGCFVVRGLTPPDPRPVTELRRITQINEMIAQYLIENPLPHASISFDRVTDYMNHGMVLLIGFERFHQLLDLTPHFGHSTYGIFETPRDIAMKLIMESDIIVLTDPVHGRSGYPLDTKITEYWNDIATWTRANRVLLYSTVIFGTPHQVYVPAGNAPRGHSNSSSMPVTSAAP